MILGLVMIGSAVYNGALAPRNDAFQDLSPTQIEKNLKQEYELITILPEPSLIESIAYHKSNLAAVGGRFSTKLEFEDIRKYYDKELISKGWKFLKETKATSNLNGKNYKIRTIYYLKGGYMVWIENPGMFDKMETFTFIVTWGFTPV